MVGLVIVSHSRALADALVGLLRQVASPDLPVAVAAGIGEDRTEFGTDAVEIMEAIQSVYSEEGVLVLMDLGMPRMDGFAFIDRLRRHDNLRLREVPAAALTAYARSEDRMRALQAGFQIHLAKPIDPAELITTIASLARRVVVKNPETSPDSSIG